MYAIRQLLLSTSTTNIYTQYKYNQYLFSVQVQLVIINIDIFSIQLQLSFLAYYLLRFVAHFVLFTIPSSSKGVSEVGPSSSYQ